MVVTIYWSYAFTPAILRRLGKDGQQIVNRLSAFLVFCVGLQIAWEGIRHLIAEN
jgi:multiple antibiotic resistance protein